MSTSPQIVIFGATGDLVRSKLIPALLRMGPRQGFSIVGVARSDETDESFRKLLLESLDAEDRERFAALADRIHYQQADVADAHDLEALSARLDSLADPGETGRLFYLSLKPSLFRTAIFGLAEAGLLAMREGDPIAWRRIVVEKPFGSDEASARALNQDLHQVLREEQIYRIDHYLGKETVQNLLGFRFHNAIFEPVWNRHHVELVQITVAEQIGVEKGRAGFYDETGALRDLVQNHMLQILALTAMEPPPSLDAEAVRDQKVALLRALQYFDAQQPGDRCVRARYGPGEIEGRRVAGYAEEAGVSTGSEAETFVALRAEIESWRWKGVPFLLRHGKRLPKRFTEVEVQFRTPPLQLFNRPDGLSDAELRRRLQEGSLCQNRPNRLTLRLQPDEGIRISFGVKQPGSTMNMEPASLDFDYREHFGQEPPGAYERLLVDALRGDPTLFLRGDEVETAWRFIDVVRGSWPDGVPPLREYPAGSWGPPEADALFEQCHGSWSRG